MLKIIDKITRFLFLTIFAFLALSTFYINAKTFSPENTNTNNLNNPKVENVERPLVTADFLKEKYNSNKIATTTSEKIKILIVPGHDFEYSGAMFNGIKEADLTLEISEYLKNSLEKDSAFEVYTTRDRNFINLNTENNQDKNGYVPDLQNFLNQNIFQVLAYRQESKNEHQLKIKKGIVEPLKIVEHNVAPGEMLYRLYAINKWVEENNIDLVLHLHFNDYPGRRSGEKKYKGFSLYVPDNSLKNGKLSQEIGKEIFKSLKKVKKPSNNPVEKKGLIPGSELIALGANNTIKAPSILIEYGYIYEDDFINQALREKTFSKLSEQTYLGIKKYLESL